MKRNNKNKNIQTSKVYPTLPEYQYVTGMPRYKNGAEYFSYDDYMTDTILADEGTETKLPPYLMKYNVDSSNPGNVLFGEKVEYGVPEFLRNSSPLASVLTGVSKFKNVGKDFKNAFANINPKTGKPYSKMDFARNTLTNTTDGNVQINMENLINAYDKKGNIIDEKNTAENLFITQKDARANYFNELAKQHSETYVDDEGNPLLSQKQMDKSGNVTYVDPDATRTVGDKVQDHIKDINAQRIKFNDDFTEVTEFSRYNDEGKKEVGTYDPNARYEEMEYEDIYNIQDELNEANQYLRAGGGFPRNNLAAFVYGGEEIPRAQIGKFNFRNYTLRDPNITIGTKTIAPINRITRNLPFGAVDKGIQQGYGFNANIPLISSQLLKTPTSQLVGNINIGTNAYRTPGSERYATKYVDSDMDIMMENAPPHLQNVQSAYGAYQDYSAPYMTNVGQRIGIGGDYTYSPRGLGRGVGIDLGTDIGLNYSRGELGSNVAYADRFDNFHGLPNDAAINIFDTVTPDIEGNLFGFDAGAYAGLRNQRTGLSGGLYGNYGTMRTINPGVRLGAKGSIPLYTGKGNLRGLKITANPDVSYDFQSGTPRFSFGLSAGLKEGGENLQKYQGDVGPSETSEKTYRFNGVQVTKEEFDRLSKEAQNNLNSSRPNFMNQGPFTQFDQFNFADNEGVVDSGPTNPGATTSGQSVNPIVTTPSMDEIAGGTPLDLDLPTPDYMNPLGMNQEVPTNPNQPVTMNISEGEPVDNTNIPVVEPEGPAAPLEMSFSKPDLTDEQKANMTEDEIKAYERQQKMDSAYNQANAFMNTGIVGAAKQTLREIGKYGAIAADTINTVLGEGNRVVDELQTKNEQDEVSDFMNPIEASRGDKGDFDINTGVYRATSLGYGDGPQGQLAQMGTETKGMPEPDYRSLQKFLNQAVVAYDPQTLLMQAKQGDEIIDADMKLIKDLMAAGADFEII
tara:strand:+ start:437 stop:3328 length:2892 start_codon:yes stop_codon:yes gene_type:complete